MLLLPAIGIFDQYLKIKLVNFQKLLNARFDCDITLPINHWKFCKTSSGDFLPIECDVDWLVGVSDIIYFSYVLDCC